MQIVNLVQGSPEWHKHRSQHFNASDAPAMLGCSPYKSRSDLLKELVTGQQPEVDAATQRIFDNGHKYEALARPLAEKIIGEDLYPVIGVEGKLSASFDGLTMMYDIGFEHKSLNDELRSVMVEGCAGDDLPKVYRVQMEQQCMVSGCTEILFMASKWDENDNLIEERHCWYNEDMELRDEILQGWAQFSEDMDNYEHAEVVAQPEGIAPEDLPALRIEVTGMVTASNLEAFKDHALAVFASINTELNTDADFANAEKTVKWCGEIESKLEAAKQHALSQTASIDELFRAIDHIKAEARAKRLELDKKVKSRKESLRTEIRLEAQAKLNAHIDNLNERIRPVSLPQHTADFTGVMKGKKTVTSLHDAVDTELARVKIETNAMADAISKNLDTYKADAAGFEFLFNDLTSIALKDHDDFKNLIQLRIANHKADEEEKKRKQEEETQRRIKEAEDRAKREAEAKAQAEADARARAEYEAEGQGEEPKPAPLPSKQPTVTAETAKQAADSIEKVLDEDLVSPVITEQSIVRLVCREYGIAPAQAVSLLAGMDFSKLVRGAA